MRIGGPIAVRAQHFVSRTVNPKFAGRSSKFGALNRGAKKKPPAYARGSKKVPMSVSGKAAIAALVPLRIIADCYTDDCCPRSPAVGKPFSLRGRWRYSILSLTDHLNMLARLRSFLVQLFESLTQSGWQFLLHTHVIKAPKRATNLVSDASRIELLLRGARFIHKIVRGLIFRLFVSNIWFQSQFPPSHGLLPVPQKWLYDKRCQ